MYSLNLHTLKQEANKFMSIYKDCAMRVHLENSNGKKKEIMELISSLKRGHAFTIVACGMTKAGKSTFLNFLIGPDTNDPRESDAEIFLVGVDAETSTPWLFQESRDIPSDNILVNHFTKENQLKGEYTFTTIKDLQEHLKKSYSRIKIEKIKTKTHSNPYSLIKISYGFPSKNLNQNLFKFGINIIDLPGLNELGIENAIKILPSNDPFIIICCMDYSTGFFKTLEYEIFKNNIVKKYSPEKIIFVITNLEKTFEKMQSLQLVSDKAKKYSSKKYLNYDILIPKVENEIYEVLRNDFKKGEFEIFLFDPYSENEEIVAGAQHTRNRLLSLRNELMLERRFLLKAANQLHGLAKSLQDQLYMIGKKSFLSDIEDKYTQFNKEIHQKIIKLKNELEEELLSILYVVANKLIDLLKTKKEMFMKDKPNEKQLNEKILNWIQNEGFQNALWDVIKARSIKFLNEKKSDMIETISQKLDKIFYQNVRNDQIAMANSLAIKGTLNTSITYFIEMFAYSSKKDFALSIWPLFQKIKDISVFVYYEMKRIIWGIDFDQLIKTIPFDFITNMIKNNKKDIDSILIDISNKIINKLEEEILKETSKLYEENLKYSLDKRIWQITLKQKFLIEYSQIEDFTQKLESLCT